VACYETGFGASEKPSMSSMQARSIARLGCSLCLTLWVVMGGSTALAERQLLDRVIAVVDEDVVLLSELEDRMNEIRMQARANNETLPPESEIRPQVLEALITENLQMQLAKRVSIRFDDDTINRVLDNMAQNNNMSFDDYVATLERNGVYLATREQVRKQMTLQELQRGMVNRRITITDQEIQNFLNSEMGREVMAAEYLVNHLLVMSDETDSEEMRSAKLKYAADLVARLKDGESFTSVRASAQRAQIFNVDGTDFGWRRANQLPNLFSGIVANMNVGTVEGPIQAPNGYHIIQLGQKRGGTEQIVNQTHVRHIMLSPNEIRDEEQTHTAIERLRQRVVDGEDFATLARQNSDDASSVVAGGDLDWINPGGMPPEMESVVNALEPGELSEPFRTSTGWHIAEVLERRVEDLSRQYARRQAENALRNRKFELELQNWLIEIREEAFVELVE
jgi:peptidyl-prolyl cis-trans isomerase SurA